MAKKVKAVLKLQVAAGKATPAPPVGPALGQHGVNMAFCKSTTNVLPHRLVDYPGRDHHLRQVVHLHNQNTPTVDLIKKALGAIKSSSPNRKGRQPSRKVREIAEMMKDLNANDIEGAIKMVGYRQEYGRR